MTYEGRLFAEVWSVASHAGPQPTAAEATFILQAVYAAATGANLAGLQAGHSSMGTVLQNFKRHEVGQ